MILFVLTSCGALYDKYSHQNTYFSDLQLIVKKHQLTMYQLSQYAQLFYDNHIYDNTKHRHLQLQPGYVTFSQTLLPRDGEIQHNWHQVNINWHQVNINWHQANINWHQVKLQITFFSTKVIGNVQGHALMADIASLSSWYKMFGAQANGEPFTLWINHHKPPY